MPRPCDVSQRRILFFGDLLLIVLATYLAIANGQGGDLQLSQRMALAMAVIPPGYFISFYIFDLYNLDCSLKSMGYLVKFLYAIIAGTLSMTVAFHLFPSWTMWRGIFSIDMLLVFSVFFFFLYFWRIAFNFTFSLTRQPKTIAIAGSGWAGQTIYAVLSKRKDYDIKGFIDDDPAKRHHQIGSHRVIGDSRLLLHMAAKNDVDAVVVAITHERNSGFLDNLVESKMRGLEVYEMPSLYERLTGKLPVQHLRHGWLLNTPFNGVRRSIYTKTVKRLLDVGCSALGLVLSAPISILTACAIKLESRGPVLYRQKRVGLRGEVYEIMKFRSMKVDAEANGAVWARVNDPRVTRVGRVIRKTRIDEIPQMWNVLKGEMSFIGPRPERPEFVGQLKCEMPFYSLRHNVKPGITGWAQVNFRYGASKEDSLEKLQYDLFYLKNLSVSLDLSILLKTVKVIFFVQGGR